MNNSNDIKLSQGIDALNSEVSTNDPPAQEDNVQYLPQANGGGEVETSLKVGWVSSIKQMLHTTQEATKCWCAGIMGD